MRVLLFLAALLASLPLGAQVYRWVDDKGTVQYSNSKPPAGVKHTVVDIDAKAGPPSADSTECHTVRCQGERMEKRLARRQEAEAKADAARAALPPGPRGLDFRSYLTLRPGMTEAELVVNAGAPDLMFHEHFFRTYTYLPTLSDPFTTVVTVNRGRITEIERLRKF